MLATTGSTCWPYNDRTYCVLLVVRAGFYGFAVYRFILESFDANGHSFLQICFLFRRVEDTLE